MRSGHIDSRGLAQAAAESGLYRPQTEHDACGMGFVAHIKGKKSHEIVQQALVVLDRLTHRGGCGCDPLTGDGAGILVQVPHDFLLEQTKTLGFALPDPGHYGVGMLFLPREAEARKRCVARVESSVADAGYRVIGWREVPVEPEHCGQVARQSAPSVAQVFVAPTDALKNVSIERKLFLIRKRIENVVREQRLAGHDTFYICSLSSRTLVYKGLLLAEQIPLFYPDLKDPRFTSALALVHSRFSTNTFPSWERAHPYRYMAHNGEINTLRGNVNWMHAREGLFRNEDFGEDVERLKPIIDQDGSDSAIFDNALELLLQTGRSLPHAMLMMIPEAWEKHDEMSEERRAFYEYHSSLMEPWDGPASIAFTDGVLVGAMLDRNGLRPSRYVVTKDDLVVLASEVGVLDIPPENVLLKSRLEPGKIFLVDTAEGRIVDNDEIKDKMASRKPYREWIDANLVKLDKLPAPEASSLPSAYEPESLLTRHHAHGYTREDIRLLIRPMAVNGQEAVGSMGNDAPLAVLSNRPQLLFNYFKQLFAQVTNPPIDPLRESLVMSIKTTLGAERNLFEETPEHCRQLELEHPVLTNEELRQVKDLDRPGLRTKTLSALFDLEKRGAGLESALDTLCNEAERSIDEGYTIVVLSDRGHDRQHAPIPSLLATAAVHHHLIRTGKRTRAGIVVESGEPREVMHFCLLFGYGAGAVNPYLAFESICSLHEEGRLGRHTVPEAILNYIKAVDKGVLKVMSKMGISTLESYRGAQIFEAIGLNKTLVEKYLTWTHSRIEGIGLEEIAAETAARHHLAYEVPRALASELDVGGVYQWRRRGEEHMYNPETIGAMQHAVRSGNYQLFKKYSARVNEQTRALCTIRGLLKFKKSQPIPLDEVEPVAEIVKRFKTGAMSFGSISKEAHENLAIAMNRIGARSNTGEGGEDPARFTPDANGDLRRSAIKQVASGRFGVTSMYLVHADELQIKMAQGAKPGEGGQLPGHKVDDFIAKVRHSTPGVGLISPPPHHDIYSIEDLAQLIHDLKNANTKASITVKLVSEVGVGTVAAGVAKAKADLVLISGDSGGTGASPLTSIKHAGTPWELGLAETQQTLVINNLRNRIRVETDGQVKTGRDVAIACLLGAEEFGFGTSALVASGCILMRVCHLNTCPVGVATQDPELRKRFKGQPEHVINFMYFIAQELREIMAQLGFRTIPEMVGRVDRLEADEAVQHWKAKGLDLSPVLHMPDLPEGTPLHCTQSQDHGIEHALDNQLIALAAPALDNRIPVKLEMPIRNANRTACTMLSSEVTRRHGEAGLPPETIQIRFYGSGGQSFGAFLANGLDIRVEGDSNDYFGKGMSGGRMTVLPPKAATYKAENNIIVGNVALYGATAGEVYICGRAGERFGVRNSGATAVVEGVGDHGCEYMTGGVVLVIGKTGRNFAAGMSGGVAYVLDMDGSFARRCNPEMVDLEPLDEQGEAQVRKLLNTHHELTGSELAWQVLSTWQTHSQRFVRVMPREYKRIIESQRLDTEFSRLATV